MRVTLGGLVRDLIVPQTRAARAQGSSGNRRAHEVSGANTALPDGVAAIVAELAAQRPDVRPEVVESFRTMIAQGAYQPDSRRIAERVIG